jgi:hypothetical protein
MIRLQGAEPAVYGRARGLIDGTLDSGYEWRSEGLAFASAFLPDILLYRALERFRLHANRPQSRHVTNGPYCCCEAGEANASAPLAKNISGSGRAWPAEPCLPTAAPDLR